MNQDTAVLRDSRCGCRPVRGALRGLAFAVLLAAVTPGVFAQGEAVKSTPFSLAVQPGFSVPVAGDGEFFASGLSLAVSGRYALPVYPRAGVGASLAYSLAPLDEVTGLSLVSAAAEAGLQWPLTAKVSLDGRLQAGYYFGFLNDGSGAGNHPYAGAGLGASWKLRPALAVGVGASYRNFLGLYNDLLVAGRLEYTVRARAPRSVESRKPEGAAPKPLPGGGDSRGVSRGTGVDLTELSAGSVFPVFYKYYAGSPLGTITLTNHEGSAAEGLKVSLYVRQYMDNPQACPAPVRLEAGQSVAVPLQGLFTSPITEITESEIVSANIIVEYSLKGRTERREYVENLRVQGRNAMSWDDDRKAAAFVTPRDPGVQLFAKNVVSATEGKGSRAVNQNLLQAIAVLQALKEYRVRYARDPNTPYDRLSKDRTAIDFLQFPRETLQYKAGDCDDLAILYCALLESLGVETAFITVPGHIYAAFDLGLTPEAAAKWFSNPAELIVQQGQVWLPVEVTELEGGFLRAWQSGAKSWRDSLPSGQARLLSVQEAWAVYEPVGYKGERVDLNLPTATVVSSSYLEELVRFIDRELAPQVAKLKAEISRSGGSPAVINRLGVLYATYGRLELAEPEFARVVASQDYVPALVNLGNIRYLRGQLTEARLLYERAYRRDAANPAVLLALARVHHEGGQYDAAREYYSRLRQRDSGLAERYAYLDQRGQATARAADSAEQRTAVLWDE
jgi:tetratricopeptide (TPR) repeat protein